jgi:hypothetical protein
MPAAPCRSVAMHLAQRITKVKLERGIIVARREMQKTTAVQCKLVRNQDAMELVGMAAAAAGLI